MGCDYYVQSDLVIEFIDKDQKYRTVCEEGEPQNNYILSLPDYDSDDDMDTKDSKYYAELDKLIQKNTYDKLLFDNGVWVQESYCKNYSRYILTKYSQIHKLVKVYKCTYAWKRT